MISALLLDLDGVLRHFDPARVAAVERRHGLTAGVLARTAFAEPEITAVTTGRLSRAGWVAGVGRRLGSPAAAVEWGEQPWRVDAELVAVCDELRSRGLGVAVLTNGTDTIPAELRRCGLDAHLDRVFNSAEIGYVKRTSASSPMC